MTAPAAARQSTRKQRVQAAEIVSFLTKSPEICPYRRELHLLG